jgi:hypothetical protein
MDLMFTYWTLTWTFLYLAVMYSGILLDPKLRQYLLDRGNPKLTLLVEIAVMAGCTVFLCVVGVDPRMFAIFLAMNVLTKGLPLWLLRDTTIRLPNDLYVPCGLFAVYLGYLGAQGTNVVQVYVRHVRSVLDGTYRPRLLLWMI